MPQIVLTSVFSASDPRLIFLWLLSNWRIASVERRERYCRRINHWMGLSAFTVTRECVSVSVSVLTVGTAGRNKLLICPEAMPQISVFNTCVCGANKWNSFRLHCDDHRKTNGCRVAAVASNCQLDAGQYQPHWRTSAVATSVPESVFVFYVRHSKACQNVVRDGLVTRQMSKNCFVSV